MSASTEMELVISRAASAIANARFIVFTSGAGLGVDSGLPDFRGTEGFWRAYPPIARLGLSFRELATPQWFKTNPRLAWGFYGHRMMLYRGTQPHKGYAIVRSWQDAPFSKDLFVVTSNVDGAFDKAGYDPARILEVHGTLDYLQCMQCDECRPSFAQRIFPSAPFDVKVDSETLLADPATWPTCAKCGGMARPNVMMFDDETFDGYRLGQQEERFANWMRAARSSGESLVVIEVGAGKAVPTIRHTSEQIVAELSNASLIRINLRESEMDDLNDDARCFSISLGGLRAIEALDAALRRTSHV